MEDNCKTSVNNKKWTALDEVKEIKGKINEITKIMNSIEKTVMTSDNLARERSSLDNAINTAKQIIHSAESFKTTLNIQIVMGQKNENQAN